LKLPELILACLVFGPDGDGGSILRISVIGKIEALLVALDLKAGTMYELE
jgi:hypothetical protein